MIRKTVAVCPECAREVEGRVVREGETVYLLRECPDHGSYRLCVSNNGASYADFDRFYCEVLGKGQPAEKIANIWIVGSASCQMLCRYCNADMRQPAFEDMTLDDLKQILDEHGHVKLTFSGANPRCIRMCSIFSAKRRAAAWRPNWPPTASRWRRWTFAKS